MAHVRFDTQTVARLHRIGRLVSRVAALFLCGLIVVSLPGSVTRSLPPPPPTLEAPPTLPWAPDYDASLNIDVEDASTHVPLAEAGVRVFVVLEAKAYLAGQALTGPRGRATLGGLPRGAVWILVDHVGSARGTAQIALESGARTLTMSLEPEHPLHVSVDDDRGAPIPGAEIEVLGAEPLPVGARTDSSGKVTILRATEAPWIVTARASGFEEIVRRGVRDGDMRFTLRKLGALEVTVTGERGEPVPRAQVQVAGTDLWPSQSAETGDNGVVRVGALAAGAYALRATMGVLVSPIEVGVLLGRGEEGHVTLRLGRGHRSWRAS